MPAPTIDGQGPLKWDQFPLIDGPAGDVSLTIDGHTIEGSIAPWSSGWEPDGALVRMADGTHVRQLSLPAPTQPVNRSPMRGSFSIVVTHQADLIRIRRASQRGSPVLVFFGEFIEDQWIRRNAEAGQTTWRTTRRVGWNGTTRTHATHPPRAFIDSTEQTIITVGTPTAGQVKVPTSQTADQYYDTITTPVLSAGSYLTLQYWPEMLVYLSVQHAYANSGEYVMDVTVDEMLAGIYT